MEVARTFKSPKARSSSLKHKTRSPFDVAKKSEQSLNQLLEDFEEGRLNAFGNSDMLLRMNEIREMQEKLTLKHFEIDQMKTAEENKGNPMGDASLQGLTQSLEKLGTAIQSLHSTEQQTLRPTEAKTRKVLIRENPELDVASGGRITPV